MWHLKRRVEVVGYIYNNSTIWGYKFHTC